MLSSVLPRSECGQLHAGRSSISDGRARLLRQALGCIAILVAIGLVASFAVALWARNALTPVEGIVALHSRMLSQGEGLYYDLNRYPFTISPYGPIY